MSWDTIVLLMAAGFGAGLANGVAGGGSLVSFPALIAAGHTALVANVTSTVGIWPGYAAARRVTGTSSPRSAPARSRWHPRASPAASWARVCCC